LLFLAKSFGLLQLDTQVFVAMVGLAVALAVAENSVHFFRGYRSIPFSLLPRDVLWRLVVLAFCFGALVFSLRLSAAEAIWILGLTLIFLTAIQLGSDRNLYRPTGVWSLVSVSANRVRRGLTLWSTSMVQTVGGPVLAPVILGVMMSPDEVGPFFAAFRIALILDLFTLASSMVVAPLIARGHVSGNLSEAQATLRYSVLLVSLATFVSFLIILFFGDRLLALMNPDFVNAAPALTILGCGYLISVCCGPVPNIMELAGQEKLLLLRLIWFNSICLIALFPATEYFGMMGAAICTAGLRAAIHITLLFTVKKRVGIDPSIFSVWGKKT
jgi:O-antigen/teichoic acid export membrane protein